MMLSRTWDEFCLSLFIPSRGKPFSIFEWDKIAQDQSLSQVQSILNTFNGPFIIYIPFDHRKIRIYGSNITGIIERGFHEKSKYRDNSSFGDSFQYGY